MALAVLGSLVGMLAGLLGLVAFGLGWLAALALWTGGGMAGVLAALAFAALGHAPPPRDAPAPQTA